MAVAGDLNLSGKIRDLSAMTQQLGPCTQAELDAFEGLDSKSKQLFSRWVDRALKAEATIAELQYEAGMYRSLYENAISAQSPQEMQAAIRAWIDCPAEKRPSADALGQRIADIASALPSTERSAPERNNPMVPWELDCQHTVCTAPECECPTEEQVMKKTPCPRCGHRAYPYEEHFCCSWVNVHCFDHTPERIKTGYTSLRIATVECPSCRGRGYTTPAFNCRWCAGTGVVSEEDAAAFGPGD
jgi:hypothetical protein